MTDHAEDPVLLLAEAVVTLIEDQRKHDEATLREMRALVDAVRDTPHVVNVAAPEVNVAAPEIRVEVPQQAAPEVRVENRAPQVQDIRIVGLPRGRATFKRDRNGRADSIELE